MNAESIMVTGKVGGNRSRILKFCALMTVLVAGCAPLYSGWIASRYEEWRHNRLSYTRDHGHWDVVADSHSRTVHAALLRTGKIILMAGSGNSQDNFDAKQFETLLWDPTENSFTKIYTPWDVFCAGHSFLPNGNLLIAGGTKKYLILPEKSPDKKRREFQGLQDSYIFNPDTNSYEKTGSMEHARWYPTLITLANGTVAATSGLNENGDIDPGNTEFFNQDTRTWTDQPVLHKEFPTYPSLLLTADGRLFFSGANQAFGPKSSEARQSGLWNMTTNAFQPVTGLPEPQMNETAGTVLLAPAQDQKVMFLGGGGLNDSPVSTNRTAIVDLNDQQPVWKRGPDLEQAKRYPGAVVLPDDTLLVSGGSARYRDGNIRTAEIYHPTTNTFTPAAPPHVGRDYHSSYLLLPDGRVAVFGSDPVYNSFDTRVEVYSPAYLYRGERPVIRSAPQAVVSGSIVTLSVSQSISKVRLIRPGAYTHVTDTEQRSVALPIIRQTDGMVEVSVPQNPNLLPPDWYMLFVDNGADVPSVASWVHVT